MATLAAFGGFAPAQASKQATSPNKMTSKTSTSGRIHEEKSRKGEEEEEEELSVAASSLTKTPSQQSGKSTSLTFSSSTNLDSPSDSSLTDHTISNLLNTKESALEPRSLESNIANAKIKLTTSDMATAAGSHHGKSHGKYYMYAEVPKKKSYKMGFKRGNEKHLIERKESAHKSHVQSYFKWHDKKGKGSHKFEFKHEGKGKKGHHY